jgi:hypothetical protein
MIETYGRREYDTTGIATARRRILEDSWYVWKLLGTLGRLRDHYRDGCPLSGYVSKCILESRVVDSVTKSLNDNTVDYRRVLSCRVAKDLLSLFSYR